MGTNDSADIGRVKQRQPLLEAAAFMQAAGYSEALQRELLMTLFSSRAFSPATGVAPALLVMRAWREVEQRDRRTAELAEGAATVLRDEPQPGGFPETLAAGGDALAGSQYG